MFLPYRGVFDRVLHSSLWCPPLRPQARAIETSGALDRIRPNALVVVRFPAGGTKGNLVPQGGEGTVSTAGHFILVILTTPKNKRIDTKLDTGGINYATDGFLK